VRKGGVVQYLAAIQGLRGDQIVARARLRTRRALVASLGRLRGAADRQRPRSFPRLSGGPALRAVDLAIVAEESDLLARARAVRAGQFHFLNEEREDSVPVDWRAPEASRLWRFHLHYFDDAPALVLATLATRDPSYTASFLALAHDWIDRNPPGVGDGWHPYTLSRRIPNWIYALRLAGLESRPEARRIVASLWEQSRSLARNLEFDIQGNHLLANVRALMFAGAFYAGERADRLWDRGVRLLRAQVAEQFLRDGGHFERSPMYHALLLQDLLECAALCRDRGGIPGWLSVRLRRAEAWLRQMCHPDGGVALFNDCTLEGTPHAELAAFTHALCSLRGRARNGLSALHGAVGWRQQVWCGAPERVLAILEPAEEPAPVLTALAESGYFILRDPEAGHALFFDAGEPCPSHLPAHSHADLLSFELSLSGRRVIVDSGVCEYAPGPWRDYCRSTRAHNTVQVDGQDQSEVWGSFRLGRRAHPAGVCWQASGRSATVSAAHTGYRRLPGGVVHRRTVSYDGREYRIVDEVTGTGSHRVESFLHFHPDTTIRMEAGGLTAESQGVRLRITFDREAKTHLRPASEASGDQLQGWYCPGFGVCRPNPVVTLSREGALPIRMSYTISPLTASRAKIR